jgi:hypothetical protein
MKIEQHKTPPVVVPPPTYTITLDEQELTTLMHIMGNFIGSSDRSFTDGMYSLCREYITLTECRYNKDFDLDN